MIQLNSAENIAVTHLQWAKGQYENGQRQYNGGTTLSRTEVYALVGLLEKLMKEEKNAKTLDTTTSDNPVREKARDLSFMREPYHQHDDKKHR